MLRTGMQLVKQSPKNEADTPIILVPTLRAVMHFVTLCVTQSMPTRSIGTRVSWLCV